MDYSRPFIFILFIVVETLYTYTHIPRTKVLLFSWHDSGIPTGTSVAVSMMVVMCFPSLRWEEPPR